MAATATGAAVRFDRTGVLLLGTAGGLQVVDPLIGAVTLAAAGAALDMTAAHRVMAAGVSTLALAATVIAAGAVADRIGRRLALAGGLLLAAAANVIAAAAPTVWLFLAGRACAGIGLGMVFSASYGMLREASGGRIGPAVGLYGAANSVSATVLGLAAGLLASVEWRLGFLTVPAVALVLLLVIRRLPRVPRIAPGPLDVPGLVLIGLGVVLLLAGCSGITSIHPRPWTIVAVLAGLGCLVAFGVVEQRSPHPAFPISMLRNPMFVGAVILGISWNFAAGAITQTLSNLWQYVQHFSPVDVMLGQLPMVVATVVAAVVTGRLIGRGVSIALLAGLSFVALVAALLGLAPTQPTWVYGAFVFALVMAGVGAASGTTTEGNQFLVLAPAESFGVVTSSKLSVGQFGYGLGLAGSTAIISTITLTRLGRSTGAEFTGDQWSAITQAMQTGRSDDPALAGVPTQALVDAFAYATGITMVVYAVLIAAAGAVCVWLMRRGGRRQPAVAAPEPVDEAV